jgi:epoxyqueuosine reductase QueG
MSVDPVSAAVEAVIADFVENSPENTLAWTQPERAWDRFLVGYASGADPMFASFKEHVGPFHWTPLEAFEKAFPGSGAKPDELTVISWVLAQTEATKADSRKLTDYVAERWARSRIYGEKGNVRLRGLVVERLEDLGVQAMAPMLSSQWSRQTSEKYGYASTWSERHVAHAAGLGTFGLCAGLITPVGKAIRLGSAVVRAAIPATPRPYATHTAYCLYYAKGTCKKCAKRCPAGAITEAGKDKLKCAPHLKPRNEEYVRNTFGFEGYGCGLCQTGVPCESRIPIKITTDA